MRCWRLGWFERSLAETLDGGLEGPLRGPRLAKGGMKTTVHKSKGLPPELKAQLAALPDETIDLSDMPEVTDWTGWSRGRFYRPLKQQLTLRLDADLVEWFKARQGGKRGYQTAINAALRKVVEDEMRKAG